MVVRERFPACEELGVAEDRVLHRRAPANLRPRSGDFFVRARLGRIVRPVDEKERRMESVANRASDLAVLEDAVVRRGTLQPCGVLPMEQKWLVRDRR